MKTALKSSQVRVLMGLVCALVILGMSASAQAYDYYAKFLQTASWLATQQKTDGADFGGIQEAEDMTTIVETDNTQEAIWVWCRYAELTGDYATYLTNINNAWTYCNANPAWLEGDTPTNYYTTYNVGWGMQAEMKYRQIYGGRPEYVDHTSYGQNCAQTLVDNTPGTSTITDALVLGRAVGSLYQYGVNVNNATYKNRAVVLGGSVRTWLNSNTSNFASESWAVSAGVAVWGVLNSYYKDPANSSGAAAWAATADTYMPASDTGTFDGYQNGHNGWYAWGYYAVSECLVSGSFTKYQNLIDTLLSEDADNDGGIPQQGSGTTNDFAWTTAVMQVAANYGLIASLAGESTTAAIDQQLLDLIDEYAPTYYRSTWNMNIEEFKAWIATIAWGEGGKGGYGAHSQGNPGTDLFAHKDYPSFTFSTGIGPFQLDRGGYDGWNTWPTEKKLDAAQAVQTVMNQWHTQFPSAGTTLQTFANNSEWYSVKPGYGNVSSLWLEVTGTVWSQYSSGNVSLNWSTIETQLAANASDTSIYSYASNVQDIGMKTWNITASAGLYTESGKSIIFTGAYDTWHITARTWDGTKLFQYYYTYDASSNIEVWVLDNATASQNALCYIFERECNGPCPERYLTNPGDTLSSPALNVGTDTTPTYTVLHSFTGGSDDGQCPSGDLTLCGSSLYGMTYQGGSSDRGTVFRINKDGTGFTILHSFIGGTGDGLNPLGSLRLSGSTLYGMTSAWAGSTVFKIKTDGTGYTNIHNFWGLPVDGDLPNGSLTLSGSTLYGMTSDGGISNPYEGTVFKIKTDGTGYAILHTFTDGRYPSGDLTLSGSTLYGMTSEGGSNGYGVVFKINTDGTGYTNLHNFAGRPDDGAHPLGSLTLSGSTLYGMTWAGGISGGGGTVFKINTDGTGYTIIQNLAGDGANPPRVINLLSSKVSGSLTLSGSTLYGMTIIGGSDYYGTVFQVNTDGTGYTILHSFTGGIGDGDSPLGSLTLSGSTLYGMTCGGGSNDDGVVFALSLAATPTDTLPPTISAFSVSPSTVTLGQGFTISYAVSDSGGSHLKQVELWRANVDGTINDPSWAQIGSTISLSGDGPSSGSFPTDIPPTAGTYWYGIDVYDNAGNWNDERNSETGGVPNDFGPNGRVTVTSPSFPTVATPTISPTGGTFTNSVKVTLSCATAGATIRYTTDGTEPTSSSTKYKKTALTLTNSVTLKAQAFKTKLADSAVATATFTIIPPPPLTITTTSLPDRVVKVKYTTQLAATGGVAPYKWSLVTGSKLPKGLTLKATTGVIAGKPTKTGTFNFTVKVTDAKKQFDTQTLSLTVN
jgi:uncharacterized repeat protein (TIGR03803 family)